LVLKKNFFYFFGHEFNFMLARQVL
jgi:hypothetical protein